MSIIITTLWPPCPTLLQLEQDTNLRELLVQNDTFVCCVFFAGFAFGVHYDYSLKKDTFEYPVFMHRRRSLTFLLASSFRANAGSFALGLMGRQGHPDKGASLCGGAVLQGGWTKGLEAPSRRRWGCFPPIISTLFQHISKLWHQSRPGWTILVDWAGEGYFLPLQSARAGPAWLNGS